MPDNLPRILAGPIVRRVQPQSCSFWIAMSVQADVSVSIWAGTQLASTSSSPLDTSSVPTSLHKFGDNLYVGVITLSLSSTKVMTPGSIFSYNLSFTGAFGTSNLLQEGLLSNESSSNRIDGVAAEAPLHLALGYIENRLPSFITPSATVDNLHLAHASCRKPHAPKYDAMAWLSDQIEANYLDTDNRIQQVYLTGDQIYADDVAGSFLPMLNQLGTDLLGAKTEQLPINGTNFDGSIDNFPALRRTRLIRQTAKLSSTAGSSHLLTFSEFISMYLAVWSPRVWRALASNDELFVVRPASPELQNVLTDFEACYQGTNPIQQWRDDKERSTNEKRDYVTNFNKSVSKVAQALANVSTYMIFDDHEITDDWNLNQRWRNRVYSNPLGKAIVRNGMMAYGICQGWGNDPAEFAKNNSKNKKFLEETQKLLGTSPDNAGPLPAGSTSLLDEIIGLTETAANKKAKWNYTVPGPRYLVCVLDTRTQRKFKGQGLSPPDLLGDTLNKQVPKGPFTDGKELLFIISAAPVLGPHIIEQVSAPLYEIIGDLKYGFKKAQRKADDPCHPGDPEVGAEAADAESWAANEAARENFLKRIALYDKSVILSGDVHYACSMRMDYWKGNNPNSIPIIQLTSSPSHNSFNSNVEALLRSNALLQLYEEGLDPELLGWNNKNPFSLPSGTQIGPGRRARMNRSPALLPSRNWPEGVTITANQQPNWRWRIKLIKDTRENSDLPPDAPRPPVLGASDLNPTGTGSQIFNSYIKITARHQTAAATGNFLPLRRMVFIPNIGLIDVLQDGELTVRHTLLSHSATSASKGVENTVHQTSLTSTDEAAPTLHSGVS